MLPLGCFPNLTSRPTLAALLFENLMLDAYPSGTRLAVESAKSRHVRLGVSLSRISLCLFVVYLLVTVGCATVGPDFTGVQPPPVGGAYTSAEQEESDSSQLGQWWTLFRDPTLELVLQHAQHGNFTVQEALHRIEASRARVCFADANFKPNGNANLTSEFRKRSGNSQPFVAQNADPFGLISVGFDSAWEIDLFGKLARTREAAYADLVAAEYAHDEIRISLLAEVAATYINIRLNQELLHLTQQSIDLQSETIELVTTRAEAGVSTKLDAAQAKAFRHRTEANLNQQTQRLDLQYNKLAVLLGGVSQDELRAQISSGPIPFPMMSGIGVPADLLRFRPDVRRAESEVAAASARIGVAKADLYPQLSLLGTISLDAKNISDLFTSESLAFGLGPSFRWNIFHFGRICCNIDQQRAMMDEKIAAYRNSVVRAVREVEDGLVQYNGELGRAQNLQQAIQHDRDAVGLALQRYKVGRANFQRVLDSQQQLLQDLLNSSTARANASTQLVRTFKAVGGGCQPVMLTADGSSAPPNFETPPGQMMMVPSLGELFEDAENRSHEAAEENLPEGEAGEDEPSEDESNEADSGQVQSTGFRSLADLKYDIRWRPQSETWRLPLD